MDIKSYEKFSVGRIVTIISKLCKQPESEEVEEIDLSQHDDVDELEKMLSFI